MRHVSQSWCLYSLNQLKWGNEENKCSEMGLVFSLGVGPCSRVIEVSTITNHTTRASIGEASTLQSTCYGEFFVKSSLWEQELTSDSHRDVVEVLPRRRPSNGLRSSRKRIT